MAPYTILPGVDLIAEIAPGDRVGTPEVWEWVDITDDVRVKDGLALTVGRQNEGSAVDAGTCNLVLDNRSGDYCRTNPMGAHFPDLGRNTPLRLRLRPVRDAFGRTASNGWGSADSGQAWTAVGGSAANYAVGSGKGTIALSTVNVSRNLYMADIEGLGDCDAQATFSVSAVATGAAFRAGLLLRADPDDPSATHWRAQISFGLLGVLDIALVQRAAGVDTTIQTATAVETYSANTPVYLRAHCRGSSIVVRYSMNGTDWTTIASDDWLDSLTTTKRIEGTFGVRALAATGNTNVSPVVSVDDYSLIVDRFLGDVPEWAPRWDKSGADQRVSIQAAGIIRRLSRGKAPADSPLVRFIRAQDPDLYWPLEEGSAATAAVALAGGINMALLPDGTGDVGFGGKAQNRASPAVVNLAGKTGYLVAEIPPGAVSSSHWTVEFMLQRPSDAEASGLDRVTIWIECGTGTLRRFEVKIDNTNEGILTVTNNSAATVATLSHGTIASDAFPTSSPDNIAIECEQNGGNIDVTAWNFGFDDVATVAGTLGEPRRIIINPNQSGLADMPSIGHVAVYSGQGPPSTFFGDAWDAGGSWSGEVPSERLERLCDEEGISFEFIFQSEADFMNAQGVSPVMDLLREAEAADHGFLHEYNYGFRYLLRTDRYNRATRLTLNRALGQIAEAPEPLDNDERLTNQVKATRTYGGSATYTSTDPAYDPNGAASPGLFADEVTLSLSTDERLIRHAEWLVWLGTQDDLRWPVIAIDLAASPEIAQTWLETCLGDRITWTDPPPGVPQNTLELLLEGYTERFSQTEWRAELNCSPMRPHEIAVIEGDASAAQPPERIDSDTSTLNTGIDSDDTSLSVASSGVIWSTTGAEYPADLDIGGEQITVTAVSGGASPQTFTVTRSVNGVTKSHLAGATVSLWRPPVLGM